MLVNLFNGKLSLRELSFKLNKNIVDLIPLLTQHCNKGYLDFMEIPDIPTTITAEQYRSKIFTNQKNRLAQC